MSEVEPTRPTRPTRPARPARRRRRLPGLSRDSEARRRLPALVMVIGLLALAGVANAAWRAPRSANAPATASDPVVALGATISSAAWFCPGPLPIGRASAPAVIAVANLSRRRLAGSLVVADGAGTVAATSISFPPDSERELDLIEPGPSRTAAATVSLDHAGAAVEELVEAPSGPEAVTCVDEAARTAYLAPGASQGAGNVDLAIYDPGATPSVASVRLGTSSGAVAPPALQDVPVGAGALVVLGLGREDPGQSLLSASVHASGGAVVVGAELTVALGHGVETTLVTANGAPGRSWTIPPAPAGAGTVEELQVYDPGRRAAHVSLRTGGSAGLTSVDATVPAGGVVALAPPPESAGGALRYEQLVVTSGGSVVVARQLAVESRTAASSPKRTVSTVVRRVRVAGRVELRRVQVVRLVPASASEPLLVPSLPVGYAVTQATSRLAEELVLPLGEATASTGELVAIANPSTTAAHVRLERLAGGSGGEASLQPPLEVTVAPGGAATIALGGAKPASPALAEVVRSDVPIAASAILYARKAPTSIGITTPVALPVEP